MARNYIRLTGHYLYPYHFPYQTPIMRWNPEAVRLSGCINLNSTKILGPAAAQKCPAAAQKCPGIDASEQERQLNWWWISCINALTHPYPHPLVAATHRKPLDSHQWKYVQSLFGHLWLGAVETVTEMCKLWSCELIIDIVLCIQVNPPLTC